MLQIPANFSILRAAIIVFGPHTQTSSISNLGACIGTMLQLLNLHKRFHNNRRTVQTPALAKPKAWIHRKTLGMWLA